MQNVRNFPPNILEPSSEDGLQDECKYAMSQYFGITLPIYTVYVKVQC